MNKMFSKIILFLTERKSSIIIFLLLLALLFISFDVHFLIKRNNKNMVEITKVIVGERGDGGTIKELRDISNGLSPLVDAIKEQNGNINTFKNEVKRLCDLTTNSMGRDAVLTEKELKINYPVLEFFPATNRKVDNDRIKKDILDLLKRYNVTSSSAFHIMKDQTRKYFEQEYNMIVSKVDKGKYDKHHWYYLFLF